MLTKQDAERIADKLEVTIERAKRNRPHDLMIVVHEGKIIASFGIRRGSRKDAGHDHIPNSLHASPHFCKELAECPKSKDDWLRMMKEKDLL